MKKFNPSSQAIAAAALQDHLLRSISSSMKPGPATRKNKNLVSFGRAIVKVPKPIPHRKEDQDRAEIDKKHQAWTRQLTLAQRLGIASKPDAPLNYDEWIDVEKRAEIREEHKGKCPICQERFATLPTVILSCSHIFHRQCLASFEKFSHSKFCPICRKKSYEKKNFTLTNKYYTEECAIRIQAFYRGHIARKRFDTILEQFPPQHPLVRRKYYGKKLKKLGSRIESDMRKREDAIDAMFREMDDQIEKSREVFQAFTAIRAPPRKADTNVDWDSVRRQARTRNDKDCSICLQALTPGRDNTLLSCSHLFHTKCVQAFEYFSISSCHTCPVCRHSYTRTNY